MLTQNNLMKIHSYFKPFSLLVLSAALFSCNQEQKADPVAPVSSDTLSVKPASTTSGSGMNIAFIYGDSVNNRYQFLLDAEAELESERKRIDRRLQNKLSEAEKRAGELQRQAPTMTQTQMQEAQLELQNLDLEMQQYQERLAADFRKREVELQKEYVEKVNSYLDDYNADGTYDMVLNFQQGGNLLWIKDSYNITNEVIDGLNRAYEKHLNEKKANQAKP